MPTGFFRSDRPLGLKVLVASLALGGLSLAPLLAYAALGPSDGNPIGLGLLAVLGVPLALLGAAAGLVLLVLDRRTRKR